MALTEEEAKSVMGIWGLPGSAPLVEITDAIDVAEALSLLGVPSTFTPTAPEESTRRSGLLLGVY